jgi:hypothetical protein
MYVYDPRQADGSTDASFFGGFGGMNLNMGPFCRYFDGAALVTANSGN